MTRAERLKRWVGGWRPGFSPIELLFVLLLIGTIATMMVPSLVSSQQKLQIEAAVQQLRLDLSRARSDAVSQNQAVTVTRTGTNTYTVAGVGARELEGKVTFGTLSATTITFTSSGTLTPTEQQTMILRLGSQTRTVVVSGAGFARVR